MPPERPSPFSSEMELDTTDYSEHAGSSTCPGLQPPSAGVDTGLPSNLTLPVCLSGLEEESSPASGMEISTSTESEHKTANQDPASPPYDQGEDDGALPPASGSSPQISDTLVRPAVKG